MELAVQQFDAFLHADDAEGIMLKLLLLQDGQVEANAIILYLQLQQAPGMAQVNREAGGSGMLHDVVHGFLNDAVDGNLDFREKAGAGSNAGDLEIDLDRITLLIGLDMLSECGQQAELIEEPRPQADGHILDAVQGTGYDVTYFQNFLLQRWLVKRAG